MKIFFVDNKGGKGTLEEKMSFEELQEIVSTCIDELIQLKQEATILKQKNAKLESLIAGIAESQKTVISNVSQCFDNIESNRHFVNQAIDNIKYELQDDTAGEDKYLIRFYDYDTTIEGIKDGKSLIRFGDGEFALMAGTARQKFQHYDKRLAMRLREIISSTEEGLMIAVADNYGSLEKYNEDGRQGIRKYMTREIRLEHRAFLDLSRTYHNAYITRPYALFADNGTDAPLKRFRQLKQIWDDRNVIFIEGALTRLGVGNDLFDNAASIRRIEAPATNSFDRYDDILKAALKYADKDVLFLVALGPAARVLVYDLYCAGYQAVDIGHADLEYEWYLNGTGTRSEVKNKYNNEIHGGDQVEDIEDKEYLSQIVEKIY